MQEIMLLGAGLGELSGRAVIALWLTWWGDVTFMTLGDLSESTAPSLG